MNEKPAYSKEFVLGLLRTMHTIRVFEHACIHLYGRGLIRGYLHPYCGQEAIAAGVCAALRPGDYVVSNHRGHGHCIARGGDLRKIAAELLGKIDGYCLGLGGSMHIADIEKGNICANGIVGGGIAIGTGAALGVKIRGDDRVTAIFFSDGASNNGAFPEAINCAAVWDLPALFILENNHYAVCTPAEKSCRPADLASIGKGYGVHSVIVNGNDAVAVYETALETAAMCRNGKGPVLIEAKTWRHGGHHVNDPGAYMPAERDEYFRSRDPLLVLREFILRHGIASMEELSAVEKDAEQRVADAVSEAEKYGELAVERFSEMTEEY